MLRNAKIKYWIFISDERKKEKRLEGSKEKPAHLMLKLSQNEKINETNK